VPSGSKTDLATEATEPIAVAEPMARLRPDEPAGALLARARMFGTLFGEHSALGAFGRFRVLERLGAGGMGVVYEAYDPDLARGVALKLVNVTAKDRNTALAEAKALARLSHPNVVPIYDVGIERDHVYLVMELVRGKTLRDWPTGHKLREILAIYQQAGLALAAAHDAGLVHRDFKPDNAVVGADGRVRVVDFGLACEAEDPALVSGEPRVVAGTPRFMAPELAAGAPVTAAADQYSFCVALAESLGLASEPTPRRIAAVLERGRAREPNDRFRSMTELLHALARDPARTRRRVGAAGGMAVSLAAVAFSLGRQGASEPDTCEGGAAQLETAWSRDARSAALGRIATLGAYGRSLRPLLDRSLDVHALRWVREYRAACVDRRQGNESDAQIDRRRTCLQRGSDAVAVVGDLIAHADISNLTELPRAAQAIPDPTSCSNRDTLMSDVPAPPPVLVAPVTDVRRRITQARVHVAAGRYEQALAEARAAVDRARELRYEPVLAEALLVQGHARLNMPKRTAAVAPLTEAMTLAIASHDDALAIEAWARRMWANGTASDPSVGLDVIEPLAKRNESARFARALLYNNLGSAEIGRNHRALARQYFERALAESQQLVGPVALELVSIRLNMGLVTDDRARADRLLVEAANELTERLGAEHPDVLDAGVMRGFETIDDLREAETVLAPLCRGYEAYASVADRTADCWTEVGLLRWDLGDTDRAIEAMDRAVRAQGDAREAAASATLLRGDAAAAAQQFTAGLAALPPASGSHWWTRLSRGRLSLGLARALRATGDVRAARKPLESAVTDLEAIIGDHPSSCNERRLGRAQVELALAQSSPGDRSPEHSRRVAAALAWLERVGGMPSEITRLKALEGPGSP
jgi:tetratricopeptide (TPR) repeat protein/predicted Ser/Thr protein kinase